MSTSIALNTVNTLNLEPVKHRLINTVGYAQDMADIAVDMYRKFLTLKAGYPKETIVPPKLVDEVWHEHILFTRDYTHMCEQINGAYIHHTPQPVEESPEALAEHHHGWERSKELFKEEFNIDIENSPISDLRVAGGSL